MRPKKAAMNLGGTAWPPTYRTTFDEELKAYGGSIQPIIPVIRGSYSGGSIWPGYSPGGYSPELIYEAFTGTSKCEYCGRRSEAGFVVCQGCGAPV